MGLKTSVNIILNRWMISTVDNIAFYAIILLDYFRPLTKAVADHILLKNGIRVNGDQPWDIQVKNDIFYAMALIKGGAGIFEAFIEEFIDCADFEQFIFHIFRPQHHLFHAVNYYHPYLNAKSLIHKIFDAQTEENTCNTVGVYYDVDTSAELFEHMLDETLQFSAMLFDNEESLKTDDDSELVRVMGEATNRMRDLLARKLKLEPGMRVLDLGCGYGGLAKYLAENYKVHVTGVTVSQEMAKRAKEACKGLDVTIHRMDYRGIRGKFDRVLCVEMLEHLGEHHHREFFENVNNWLVDDGIFVLNTISVNHEHISSYEPALEVVANCYVWMPRPENIILHSKGLFIIEDWQNLGYQLGLFSNAINMRIMNNMSYFEKHYRRKKIRKLLAHTSAGVALACGRKLQLYSIVFSKNGLPYQYTY